MQEIHLAPCASCKLQASLEVLSVAGQGRMRFASAQKRRRGQVADARQPSASYGGEATGIKARVSKSRRFG